MNWIKTSEELPEECLLIFIAYRDKDGTNAGITTGSYQNEKWHPDFLCIRGEEYDEEYSVVTHWAYIDDVLKYPYDN